MEKRNKTGFAISIDALLATILALSILTFISLETFTQETVVTEQSINLRQVADDSFDVLGNNGVFAKYLADSELAQTTLANQADPDMPGIYYEAKRLLPKNTGLRIAVSEYQPEDDELEQCRSTKDFEDCFGSAAFAVEQYPDSNPVDKEIIHGKKIVIMKETSLGKKTAEGTTCVPEQMLEFEKKEETGKALLQGETELDIETGIEVTDPVTGSPLTEISCDETAKVTVKARNTTRDPIAIMLAMDRSGSMKTYDILTQEASGIFNGGTCEDQPVWVEGRFNNALQFDGVRNYVECGQSPVFSIEGEITISMWVKIDNPEYNNWMHLLEKKYYLRYHPYANRLLLYGGGSDYAEASNVNLDTGWHHIAGVINGTTGTLYVDGINRTTNSSVTALTNSSDSLRIGYDEYFGGTMDEVRIHDRALNQGEIQQLYNGTNVASGLVGYWRFDETTGFVAQDSSTSGLSCALQNWLHVYPQDQWVPGKINNALLFNGVDNYVDAGAGSWTACLPVSFSAWVKLDSTGATMPIIVNNDYYNRYYGAVLEIDAAGHLSIRAGDGTGDTSSDRRTKTGTTVLQAGQWYHVVGVIDSISSMRLYVNSNSDNGTYSGTASSIAYSTTAPFRVGMRSSVNGLYYFDGAIDDVRVYCNQALTIGDVQMLFAGYNPGTLNLHWRFDESSGDTAVDSSGGGHNGTLYNWVSEVTGDCQYRPGDPQSSITNCPPDKSYFDLYTDKRQVASYNIGHIYPYINKFSSSYDTLYFIANSTIYYGTCTDPAAYMRLWIRRPDGVLESDLPDNYPYMEAVNTIPNGNYDLIVWSDAPIDYHIWLRQKIIGYFNNNQLSGGTHDGTYNPPEQSCSNYENWAHLTDIDYSDYNAIYYSRWRLYYDQYQSLGGDCGTPRFWVKYRSQGKEWQPGKVSNALSFNGPTMRSYVEVPASSSLNVQKFTFSGWFKSRVSITGTDSWDTYPTIFMRKNSSDGYELSVGFYYRSGNIVRVYLHGSSYNFTGANLFDEKWHHLAVTYNSSTLTVYVDGVQYGSPVSVATTLSFGNGNLLIGASPESGVPERYWFGQLDELRLYNRALSSAEVSQIYNAESAGSKAPALSGLAGFWALDESSGYAAADSSGNGNNGTAHLDRDWYTDYCGTGADNSYCDIYLAANSTLGSYLMPGEYEIWGWSDVSTLSDVSLYVVYQFWGNIYGKNYSEHLEGGTCSYQSCQMSSVPATTDYTNCPIEKGYEMAYLPGVKNEQVIDTFNVPQDALTGLSGVWVDVDFDYVGSGAVCAGAALNFQNPIDGNNWYWIYSDKVTSKRSGIDPENSNPKTFYVNDAPATPSYEQYYDWYYPPPIKSGDYSIVGWSEKDVSYSVKWKLKRLDAAKKAAALFIDNAAWKPEDEIGLVSFSTETSLDQWLTTDREAVNEGLGSLETGGETAIADAIDAAAAELVDNAESNAGRFIALLTDGKANVCRGGVPCTESQAIIEAMAAANDARSQEITVYVIGFADETLIGEYEEYLKEIALDKDDESYSEGCENGTLQFCGKYYYAADEEALQEMYKLIALEIVRTVGSMDIQIPIPAGMELSNYDGETCGIWDDSIGDFVETESCDGKCSNGSETCGGGEMLYFKGKGVSGYSEDFWWAAQFDAVLPCNSSSCSQNYVLFPPIGTSLVESSTPEKVDWDDTEGEDVICEEGESTKCFKRITFKYSDLNVAFTYGLLVTGNDSAIINLEISNNGYNNIPIKKVLEQGLEVEFYKKDKSNKLGLEWTAGSGVYLGDEGDTPLTLQSGLDGELMIAMPTESGQDGTCSWLDGLCQGSLFGQSDWKIRVEGIRLKGCPGDNCTGTIIAEINANDNVNECQLHNEGKLFCTTGRFRLFAIDYYVWVE